LGGILSLAVIRALPSAVTERSVRIAVGDTVKSGTGKNTSAALLAIPLAATMLLTACGGDTKPNASASNKTSSPATTAAPKASTSPTAVVIRTTDPKIPAAARANTPAGAEAFVRYFIDRWNDAWTGPHSGVLSPLCGTSSKSCAALEKTATRLTNAGHRYDGKPVTIKFVGASEASQGRASILANLRQERRSEIDTAGKTYVTDPRLDFRLVFDLAYTNKSWSVSSIKGMK
jgi:hypothetical protein